MPTLDDARVGIVGGGGSAGRPGRLVQDASALRLREVADSSVSAVVGRGCGYGSSAAAEGTTGCVLDAGQGLTPSTRRLPIWTAGTSTPVLVRRAVRSISCQPCAR